MHSTFGITSDLFHSEADKQEKARALARLVDAGSWQPRYAAVNAWAMRHLSATLAFAALPLWALGACADLTEPGVSSGPASPPTPEPVAAPAPKPAPAPTPAPTLRAPSGESIRVAHLLVAFAGAERATATRTKDQAKKRADQLLARAKKGEDFAALAKETSDDPTAQRNGGDLGSITRDSGFTQRFKDAAFTLKPGDVSAVVETEFGFHIIRRMP
jgi:hypothetical protein